MAKPTNLKPSGTAHIHVDEQGRAWIDDTNVRVIQIVLDTIGINKLTPEQIHEGYPHLSLAQIHAALSWYHDHKSECDAEIERREREIARLRAQTENPELQERLRKLSESGFRP